MGASKEILSTEAVTTGAAQCFIAASAAAISIQYINRPPIRFPKVLVSLGNTNSVITTRLSAAFFASMKKICTKLLKRFLLILFNSYYHLLRVPNPLHLPILKDSTTDCYGGTARN